MKDKYRDALRPVSREVVEQVARIIGEYSSAGRALKELDERLEKGENVCIFAAGNSWVVGPAPPTTVTI